MIYAARFDTINALFAFLTEDCCGGVPNKCSKPAAACKPAPPKCAKLFRRRQGSVTDRAFDVLFLCTGNAARLIMAEAILDKLEQDEFSPNRGGIPESVPV